LNEINISCYTEYKAFGYSLIYNKLFEDKFLFALNKNFKVIVIIFQQDFEICLLMCCLSVITFSQLTKTLLSNQLISIERHLLSNITQFKVFLSWQSLAKDSWYKRTSLNFRFRKECELFQILFFYAFQCTILVEIRTLLSWLKSTLLLKIDCRETHIYLKI